MPVSSKQLSGALIGLSVTTTEEAPTAVHSRTISESSSGFVVALFDDQGYLLEVLGDADVVERVKKGNFIQGFLNQIAPDHAVYPLLYFIEFFRGHFSEV